MCYPESGSKIVTCLWGKLHSMFIIVGKMVYVKLPCIKFLELFKLVAYVYVWSRMKIDLESSFFLFNVSLKIKGSYLQEKKKS